MILVVDDLRNNGGYIGRFHVLQIHRRCFVIIQCQLILGDGETCGQQTFAVFQFVENVQQPFLAGAGLADIQRNLGCFLRSDF
jgi:hypothetical protein